MKTYSAYKPSNAEWLGDIPDNWDVKRVKFVFEIRKRIAGKEGLPVLSITQKGIKIKDIETGTGQLAMDYSDYQLVEVGDFAMNQMDLLTGFVDISKYAGVTSPDYRVFSLVDNNCVARFLLYIFQNCYTNKIFFRFGHGSSHLGRWRLPTDEFKDFPIPVPPHSEQQSIADFLDCKTIQIDTLTAKKQRQIELLQEQRTALINYAVTKGLNPDAPMKDSGVEWLGEIPSHWEIKMLKWIAYLQRGHDLPSDNRVDGEFPIVSSSGISDYHNDYKAKGPGVVTGRYGTIGEVFYVDQDYWPLNTTLYVKDFYGNYAKFIYYLLKILPFNAYSEKSAVPGVDRKDLHELLLGCPPVAEQIIIAEYLDQISEKISQAEAKINNEIALLQEYRTVLISEAVTGKIDVR